MQNTSHSKVVATVIICASVIGSVLIYNNKAALFAQKLPPQANVVVDNSAFNLQKASDTASDDWKKSLSSANNPIEIVVSQNTATDDSADNTLTGQISKEFFSLYLADKKAGVTVDQNEALNIANQTLNNLNINFQGKQYTATDIKVSQDSSDAAIMAYEQSLLIAVKNNSNKSGNDPITILNTASQSQLDSDLAPLDPIIKNYQGAISDTLKIQVPVKVIGYHIVYLNTLSNILYDLQGMRKLLTDPMIAYVAFSNYQKDAATLAIVAEQMAANFPK